MGYQSILNSCCFIIRWIIKCDAITGEPWDVLQGSHTGHGYVSNVRWTLESGICVNALVRSHANIELCLFRYCAHGRINMQGSRQHAHTHLVCSDLYYHVHVASRTYWFRYQGAIIGYLLCMVTPDKCKERKKRINDFVLFWSWCIMLCMYAMPKRKNIGR